MQATVIWMSLTKRTISYLRMSPNTKFQSFVSCNSFFGEDKEPDYYYTTFILVWNTLCNEEWIVQVCRAQGIQSIAIHYVGDLPESIKPKLFNGVRIYDASYNTVDVSSMVASQVQRNEGRFTVDNSTFGSNPMPGSASRLSLTYACNEVVRKESIFLCQVN